MSTRTCNDVQYVDGSPGEGHPVLAKLLAEEVGLQLVLLSVLLAEIPGLEVGLHRIADVPLLQDLLHLRQERGRSMGRRAHELGIFGRHQMF